MVKARRHDVDQDPGRQRRRRAPPRAGAPRRRTAPRLRDDVGERTGRGWRPGALPRRRVGRGSVAPRSVRDSRSTSSSDERRASSYSPGVRDRRREISSSARSRDSGERSSCEASAVKRRCASTPRSIRVEHVVERRREPADLVVVPGAGNRRSRLDSPMRRAMATRPSMGESALRVSRAPITTTAPRMASNAPRKSRRVVWSTARRGREARRRPGPRSGTGRPPRWAARRLEPARPRSPPASRRPCSPAREPGDESRVEPAARRPRGSRCGPARAPRRPRSGRACPGAQAPARGVGATRVEMRSARRGCRAPRRLPSRRGPGVPRPPGLDHARSARSAASHVTARMSAIAAACQSARRARRLQRLTAGQSPTGSRARTVWISGTCAGRGRSSSGGG